MKTLRKPLFPVLLILTCVTVYFWQNALASLTYLPYNCVAPLGVTTPAILVLTFLTAFTLLRQSGKSRPVLKSLLGAFVMLLTILSAGVCFLSYLSYRFAAVLPVFIVLPDWPTGIVSMVAAILCIVQLTALLICRLVWKKRNIKCVTGAAIGWILLNACLFLITI